MAAKYGLMSLKRINVVVEDSDFMILHEYQHGKGIKTRDQALAELLREYRAIVQSTNR